VGWKKRKREVCQKEKKKKLWDDSVKVFGGGALGGEGIMGVHLVRKERVLWGGGGWGVIFRAGWGWWLVCCGLTLGRGGCVVGVGGGRGGGGGGVWSLPGVQKKKKQNMVVWCGVGGWWGGGHTVSGRGSGSFSSSSSGVGQGRGGKGGWLHAGKWTQVRQLWHEKAVSTKGIADQRKKNQGFRDSSKNWRPQRQLKCDNKRGFGSGRKVGLHSPRGGRPARPGLVEGFSGRGKKTPGGGKENIANRGEKRRRKTEGCHENWGGGEETFEVFKIWIGGIS